MGIYDQVKQSKPTYEPDANVRDMRNKFFTNRKDEAVGMASGAQQQGEDAINRRFAAMGASGSGAAIAAIQKNKESGDAARRNALSDVAGQEYQMVEGDANKGLAERDLAFKGALADQDQSNKLQELDLAKQQFELDKATTGFNRSMAEAEMNKKPPGLIDSILGGGSGQFKKVISPISLVGGDATLICTELHRQGLISDYIFELDGKFGKDLRRRDYNSYQGYLILARPTVRLMQRSPLATKIVFSIFNPFCQWMANKYDKNINTSHFGFCVYGFLKITMPILFKVRRLLNGSRYIQTKATK